MSLLTDLPGEDLSPPILASDQVVIVRGGRTYLGDANLTWPGSAAASVTQPDTGAVARPVTGKVLETLSVWDFWVAPATDATAMLRLFAATGRSGIIPAGDYVVSGQIDWPSLGQVIRGEGRTKTRILINSPPSGAQAIFNVLAGEPGVAFLDIGLYFAQPENATRATAVQYPWAISIASCPRSRIENCRISGAWNGINATGNCGGAYVNGNEIGAMNIGLDIDGSQDFFHVFGIHFWPFGWTAQSQLAAYQDGTTIGARIGRADGLNAHGICTFCAQIVLNNSTGGGSADRMINGLQLDGNGATLTINGGSNNISGVYSTKSTPSVPSVLVTGGATVWSNQTFRGTETAPTVRQTGGELIVSGGRHNQENADQPCFQIEGGRLTVQGVDFALPATARTAPVIRHTGGVMRVKGCTISGPTAPVFAEIAFDNSSHDIEAPRGTSITLPANPVAGRYVDGAKRAWTPVVTFATPGDFAPTYTYRAGACWYEGNGLRFVGRVVFNAGTFSTAAGGFRITGLPVTSTLFPVNVPIEVSAISKVTLPAGTPIVTAQIDANSGVIRLLRSGSGVAFAELGNDNIVSGATGVELAFAGFLPLI